MLADRRKTTGLRAGGEGLRLPWLLVRRLITAPEPREEKSGRVIGRAAVLMHGNVHGSGMGGGVWLLIPFLWPPRPPCLAKLLQQQKRSAICNCQRGLADSTRSILTLTPPNHQARSFFLLSWVTVHRTLASTHSNARRRKQAEGEGGGGRSKPGTVSMQAGGGMMPHFLFMSFGCLLIVMPDPCGCARANAPRDDKPCTTTTVWT